jgi:hypothetical protein
MLTEPTRSKRLRKFIPQPDRYRDRYGSFALTSRDLEILELVYRYRFMEARHIRALVRGSDQQITRRLQGLFHNGYLGRYARRERMRLELDPGAPLIAYGLELNGARVLERHRPVATESSGAVGLMWRKDHTRRTEWFLEHHLMICEFHCVLDLAVRRSPGIGLVYWSQGRESWFQVRVPGGTRKTLRVAPDAYFVLRQGGDVRHYFLEADRGTEEHRRLVERYVAYWWRLQDPPFVDPHLGRMRVNVVFMTTSTRRLQGMRESLQRMPKPNRAAHGGKGAFTFGLMSDYSIASPSGLLQLLGLEP